jgi:hypothetical protein
MYKAQDMQIRPSSALPWLVAAAAFLALETSAHAEAASPAPATATATPAATETDKDKDDPRAIYLSADFGFARPDLGAFSDNLAFDKTAANGILAGIGIGYRYKALRIGGRFRDTSTTEFSLWSLMGEVGYGLPFRPLTPIIMVHAGYMFDAGVERSVIGSSLPRGNILTPNIELDGLVLGIEANAAYSITKFFRVGPFLGLDMTFLHRSQPPPPQSIVPLTDDVRKNALFGDSGSGVGYVLNLGLRVTGDIAF